MVKHRLIYSSIFLFLICLCPITEPFTGASGQPVQNGSLDDWETSNWVTPPLYWSGVNFDGSNTIIVYGTAAGAAHMDGSDSAYMYADTNYSAYIYQDLIGIKYPEELYFGLHYYCKPGSVGTCEAKLEYYNDSTHLNGSDYILLKDGTETTFTQIYFEALIIPPGADKLRIILAVNGTNGPIEGVYDLVITSGSAISEFKIVYNIAFLTTLVFLSVFLIRKRKNFNTTFSS